MAGIAPRIGRRGEILAPVYIGSTNKTVGSVLGLTAPTGICGITYLPDRIAFLHIILFQPRVSNLGTFDNWSPAISKR